MELESSYVQMMCQSTDSCVYCTSGKTMDHLPLPICLVNGNTEQSHLPHARTPQNASQTSHHRHAACLAICDLRSAVSLFPWGSWRRSQELERQSAHTHEQLNHTWFKVKTLTCLSNSKAWSIFLGNPSIRKRWFEFLTSSVIFLCKIGIIISVGSSFPCFRCSLMASSSSSKVEFRLISLM